MTAWAHPPTSTKSTRGHTYILPVFRILTVTLISFCFTNHTLCILGTRSGCTREKSKCRTRYGTTFDISIIAMFLPMQLLEP